jgi:UDP-N-acetyl-L-fucosamine synthase
MNLIKIFTLVGTRPEIIRLSAVLKCLDSIKGIEHILAHTGQNYDYELNKIFFEDLDLRSPDFYLNISGETASEKIGDIFSKLDPILAKTKPDAFLVLGDTNSCLGAYVAKRNKIPIFHMEAGNRCFDQRVPEEINRKIVDHIADINMPYSDLSREYLIREGIDPQRIVKTGSPMMEVINENRKRITSSDILSQLNLKKNEYILLSTHREENVEDSNSLRNILQAVTRLGKEFEKKIIFPAHPRTRIKLENASFGNKMELIKPLNFSDFIRLQEDSALVISDSGTISEESGILKFKALNIRATHERPEAMEEGYIMFTGTNEDDIFHLGKILLQSNTPRSTYKSPHDYNVDNVSFKVVNTILSHIQYINNFVWRK